LEINVANELHRSSKQLGLFGVKVGDSGPEGLYLSSARTNSEASKKAKVNGAAAVLHRMLNDAAINMLVSESKPYVYCEFRRPSTQVLYQGAYDNDTKCISWAGDAPTNLDALIPLVLFSLHSDSPFTETRTRICSLIENHSITGNIDKGEIYHLSDDFYFEFIKYYPTKKVFADNNLDLESIRQGYRTGQLEECGDLNGITKPPFEAISDVIPPVVEEESEDNMLALADCRAGAFKLDYLWHCDYQQYIPPLERLDNFVPTATFYSLLSLIKSEITEVMARVKEGVTGVGAIRNNYLNIILTGKPGTGKTTLAYALGSVFGMPTRTVSVSKNTEEDTYEGKTKPIEGTFKFVETPFLEGFKDGGIVVLEEFNLSDPGILMGAIGQAIEAPFILYQDGYRPVRRHPLTIIISTMNSGTQGSREPSEAFTNRFPYVFIVDDPSEEEFLEFLTQKGFDMMNCRRVYNAYRKISDWLLSPSVNEEEAAFSLSPRTCIGALTMMKNGVPFTKALESTMVGTIGIKNLTLARQVKEDIVAILPAA